MSQARSVLPHPITSALLVAAWLLLQQSVSLGHVLLGIALGIAIPLFTRRFWPERVRVAGVFSALRFIAVVIWDIIVANLSVARIALGPVDAIQPGFVRFPLDLDNDFAVTVLTNTVSLTPGTVSAELSAERSHLIIHYLACDDEEELVRTVKQRYEAPLKKIFLC